MDKTRAYTEKEILTFTLVVEQIGSSQDSFKWLIENNCIELAALCEVLLFANKAAKKWLEGNSYEALTIFLDALNDEDDKDALDMLTKGPRREWSALISLVNDNDQNALVWLIKSGLKYYGVFADMLIRRIAESDNKFGGRHRSLLKLLFTHDINTGIANIGTPDFGVKDKPGLW